MFSLQFLQPNDDFKPTQELETARILHSIADAVAEGRTDSAIVDTNGNRIGTWATTDE